MKKYGFLILALSFSCFAFANEGDSQSDDNKSEVAQQVESACGSCEDDSKAQ